MVSKYHSCGRFKNQGVNCPYFLEGTEPAEVDRQDPFKKKLEEPRDQTVKRPPPSGPGQALTPAVSQPAERFVNAMMAMEYAIPNTAAVAPVVHNIRDRKGGHLSPGKREAIQSPGQPAKTLEQMEREPWQRNMKETSRLYLEQSPKLDGRAQEAMRAAEQAFMTQVEELMSNGSLDAVLRRFSGSQSDVARIMGGIGENLYAMASQTVQDTVKTLDFQRLDAPPVGTNSYLSQVMSEQYARDVQKALKTPQDKQLPKKVTDIRAQRAMNAGRVGGGGGFHVNMSEFFRKAVGQRSIQTKGWSTALDEG